MNALENKAGVTSPRPLRPCDYFDLIAGTSTGGYALDTFQLLILIKKPHCHYARGASNGY